jgi:tetratricopeptide (TPR) repeat protein
VPAAGDDIPALTGWGNYRWKVTTPSDSAQYYYNQGMAMYYAFHIIESRASFDKATRFDSTFAMAWWGKALAFGPNINDFGYQPPSEAYPSALAAVRLKGRCTPLEKALINAIAVRYSADTTAKQADLNEKYRDAMSRVSQQFPQNADVAALYADALMLLHPWDLYNHDFSPKAWTPKIVAAIKNALRLSPRHPGANHYLIHAVEASARPGDALKSADLLATAMPSVSHITHMPSHVYIRTGYYQKGMKLNTQAVDGFKNYTAAFAPVTDGLFLYSLHNLHMKMACAHMAGNYSEALSAAKDLQGQIPADYLNLPNAMGNYLQYVHQSPLFTYIRFGKWEELLQEKTGSDLPYAKVLQHFGRGLAYARLNRLSEAASEAAQMAMAMQQEGLKEPFTPFNSAYDGAVVARHILAGTIALQQQQLAEAITQFQQAVTAEDKLIYDEPRDWLLPARHYLGDALLRAGQDEEALAVLQKDLQINPSNGWALTGLQLAFEQLHRTGAIITAKQRLKNAWLVKDVEIKRPVF